MYMYAKENAKESRLTRSGMRWSLQHSGLAMSSR